MYKIRAYKMTHATGFAPNPFDRCLTLACCKPLMRNGNAVKEGDWIIGVGTKALGSGDINNPDEAKYENRIIYVMKVQELVPWTEYYSTCQKRGLNSKLSKSGDKDRDICGDCIYQWNGGKTPEKISRYMQEEFADYISQFKFKPNIYHTDISSTVHDLGGKYVIFGDPENSYYLGSDAVQIELDTNPFEKISRAPYGIDLSDLELNIDKLIEELKRKGIKPIKDETPEILKKRIIKPKESFNSDGTIKDKKTNQSLNPELIIKAMPECISRDEVMRELNKNKVKRNPADPLIILSRKGFDTAYGRCPSLIIEGKQMVSFPIPEDSEQAKQDENGKYYPEYSKLQVLLDDGTVKSLEELILASEGKDRKVIFNSMTLGRKHDDNNENNVLIPRCHLDPQLYNYCNDPKFVASLGQMNIPARLLCKYDVKEGDLFLFFGNYRFVDKDFNPDAKKKAEGYTEDFYHCIWGYMEVGKKIVNPQISTENIPEYIRQHHPHMKYTSTENFLYIAADKLSDNWCPEACKGQIRGYGIFDFDEKLLLSPKNAEEHKKHIEKAGIQQKIGSGNEIIRNIWTILPLYVNNNIKKQIPIRGQEFVLFPDSKAATESNKDDEIAKANHDGFILDIKAVIKDQIERLKSSEN